MNYLTIIWIAIIVMFIVGGLVGYVFGYFSGCEKTWKEVTESGKYVTKDDIRKIKENLQSMIG